MHTCGFVIHACKHFMYRWGAHIQRTEAGNPLFLLYPHSFRLCFGSGLLPGQDHGSFNAYLCMHIYKHTYIYVRITKVHMLVLLHVDPVSMLRSLTETDLPNDRLPARPPARWPVRTPVRPRPAGRHLLFRHLDSYVFQVLASVTLLVSSGHIIWISLYNSSNSAFPYMSEVVNCWCINK